MQYYKIHEVPSKGWRINEHDLKVTKTDFYNIAINDFLAKGNQVKMEFFKRDLKQIDTSLPGTLRDDLVNAVADYITNIYSTNGIVLDTTKRVHCY